MSTPIPTGLCMMQADGFIPYDSSRDHTDLAYCGGNGLHIAKASALAIAKYEDTYYVFHEGAWVPIKGAAYNKEWPHNHRVVLHNGHLRLMIRSQYIPLNLNNGEAILIGERARTAAVTYGKPLEIGSTPNEGWEFNHPPHGVFTYIAQKNPAFIAGTQTFNTTVNKINPMQKAA